MGDNADRLLSYLDECGLSVVLADPPHPPGTLVLRGPKHEKTPAVLEAVKKFKPELVRRLTRGKPIAVPAPKPLPVTAEIEAACERCLATVFFPGASGGVFCDRPDCPHPKLGPVPQASGTAVYKKW